MAHRLKASKLEQRSEDKLQSESKQTGISPNTSSILFRKNILDKCVEGGKLSGYDTTSLSQQSYRLDERTRNLIRGGEREFSRKLFSN